MGFEFADSVVKSLDDRLHLLDSEPLLNVLRTVDIPGLQVEDEDPLRPRLVVAVDDPVKERGSFSMNSAVPQILIRL